MQAVADALAAAQVGPDAWDTWSDDEIVMTGVFQWVDEERPRHSTAAYPFGLAVRWDSDEGWRYGRYIDHHGSLQSLHFLPVDWLSDPASIAAAVKAICAGPVDDHPSTRSRWQHADELEAALPEEEM
ncbi:hypothetical protein SGR81_18550 [Streptomyces rimosus]|nr:hypothetical protein [Streptomyces rimosus]